MTSCGCSSEAGPSGLTLVLNGAEERLQLVLGRFDGDGLVLLGAGEWAAAGQFARILAPAVRDALALFGVGLTAVARICCVLGPGSFTGLRIVLAAAEGMAAGLGQRLAGLPYLPLLAAGPAAVLSGRIAVLTHSRQRQVYVQAFESQGVHPVSRPESVSLDEAAARLRTLAAPVFLVGSGIRRNNEFFRDLAAERGFTLLGPEWERPCPDLLLRAASRADYGHGPLVPIYLRGSDAEENLAAIAKGRGLSEKDAREMMRRTP